MRLMEGLKARLVMTWPILNKIFSDSGALSFALPFGDGANVYKPIDRTLAGKIAYELECRECCILYGSRKCGKKTLIAGVCEEENYKLVSCNLEASAWEIVETELHQGEINPSKRLFHFERCYIKLCLLQQIEEKSAFVLCLGKLESVLCEDGSYYDRESADAILAALSRVYNFNEGLGLQQKVRIVFVISRPKRLWPAQLCKSLSISANHHHSMELPCWKMRAKIARDIAAAALVVLEEPVHRVLVNRTAGASPLTLHSTISALQRLCISVPTVKDVEQMLSLYSNESSEFECRPPLVKLNDVVGLDRVKARLSLLVSQALLQPASLKKLGLSPPKGILLYGPPNTGKSMLCEAICSDLPVSYMPVNISQLIAHTYVGEAEQKIRKMFLEARKNAPCVLSIDYFEVLGQRRNADEAEGGSAVSNRCLSTLLNELDGIEVSSNKRVLLLACVNDFSRIDDALLRPGRLDYHLKVDLPNATERKFHVERCLESLGYGTSGIKGLDISSLVEELSGQSPLDIKKHVTNLVPPRLDHVK